MSVSAPGPGCYDLPFQASYPLGEPAELALEDYARAIARASGVEVRRAPDDPAMVSGVHVCGLGTSLTRAALADIEDFAREMATRTAEAGGLGWS